jgi:cyclohexyl-isocyanide hydratase
MMEDSAFIAFLAECARKATYVASVCTGALLLGEAGLLDGYRATTHWASAEFLDAYGATPVPQRVVRDRNRITGAEVSAGIDLALDLAELLRGAETAKRIQLQIEYDPPSPLPRDCGSPAKAASTIVQDVKGGMGSLLDCRRHQAERKREQRAAASTEG